MRRSCMTNEQRKLLETIRNAIESAPYGTPETWGYESFSDQGYREDLYDWELAEFVKNGYGD